MLYVTHTIYTWNASWSRFFQSRLIYWIPKSLSSEKVRLYHVLHLAHRFVFRLSIKWFFLYISTSRDLLTLPSLFCCLFRSLVKRFRVSVHFLTSRNAALFCPLGSQRDSVAFTPAKSRLYFVPNRVTA